MADEYADAGVNNDLSLLRSSLDRLVYLGFTGRRYAIGHSNGCEVALHMAAHGDAFMLSGVGAASTQLELALPAATAARSLERRGVVTTRAAVVWVVAPADGPARRAASELRLAESCGGPSGGRWSGAAPGLLLRQRCTETKS